MHVLTREGRGKTLKMKLPINAWEFIRNHGPIMLSFLIHLLIFIVFIHTVYFLFTEVTIERGRLKFCIFARRNKCMKKVVVGLSGGVDSSVAAYLLKEQGYEVIGLFMKNWHDDSVTISKECPWLEDSNDALIVAEKLGIPFQTVDLSKEYKERIVDYMFREYEKGRTPNPDVLCNREIKFDVFLKIALQLGADYVATGHYCKKGEIVDANGALSYRLLAGLGEDRARRDAVA